MLTEAIEHFIYGPCYQLGGSQKDPSSHWKIERTPDPGQETEAKMVWPCFKSSSLAKTIMQGTVKGKMKRGRQKKRREDNIKEWSGMDFASSIRAVENRTRWKGIVADSSVVPRRPSKVMGYNRIVRMKLMNAWLVILRLFKQYFSHISISVLSGR